MRKNRTYWIKFSFPKILCINLRLNLIPRDPLHQHKITLCILFPKLVYCRLKNTYSISQITPKFRAGFLDKRKDLQEGRGCMVLSILHFHHESTYLRFFPHSCWSWGYGYRCTEDMERHLEESVLSKLPDNYRDILKQSIISEENDMGTQSSIFFFFFFAF